MRAAVILALGLAVAGGAARADIPREHRQAPVERLQASFYGPGFHGRFAADGSQFNRNASTAAHKTWPFGTRARVTEPVSGLSEVITITDRGPFVRGRDLDLSEGTARRIGLHARGVGPVLVERLR
jgi:rare lipoprotein A